MNGSRFCSIGRALINRGFLRGIRIFVILLFFALVCGASLWPVNSSSADEAPFAPTDTDPTLTLAWSSTAWQTTNDVAWGDWDGDGDLDLAFGNHGFDHVYENTGGGLVLAWVSNESSDTQGIAWGDWDGDGDLDLAAGARVYENVGGTLALNPAGGIGWDGGGAGDAAWGIGMGMATLIWPLV